MHIAPIEVILSVLAFDCLDREVIHSQRIRVLVLVVVGQAAVVIVKREVLLVVTFSWFTDCQLLVLDCLFVVGDRIRQLHRFVQTQAKVIQALWFLRLKVNSCLQVHYTVLWSAHSAQVNAQVE